MMDKIDYKKKDKELYSPGVKPVILNVPKMKFVTVEGKGDPNEVDGDYQKAMELLYGISYTIKMSKMGGETPEGYHDFIVPPLEGLWEVGVDIADKSSFKWISMIRVPEFVSEEVFEWAKSKLSNKKPELDVSKLQYLSFEEGRTAQIMHIGSYDNENRTIKVLQEFIANSGYEEDFSPEKYRFHHEIYLNDPRKVDSSKIKTVIRYPIKLKK
jgi:hypothetical protein